MTIAARPYTVAMEIKGCPRCAGDLYEEHEAEFLCLMCGYVRYDRFGQARSRRVVTRLRYNTTFGRYPAMEDITVLTWIEYPGKAGRLFNTINAVLFAICPFCGKAMHVPTGYSAMGGNEAARSRGFRRLICSDGHRVMITMDEKGETDGWY